MNEFYEERRERINAFVYQFPEFVEYWESEKAEVPNENSDPIDIGVFIIAGKTWVAGCNHVLEMTEVDDE